MTPSCAMGRLPIRAWLPGSSPEPPSARRLAGLSQRATARRPRSRTSSDHRGIFYTNRGVADWRFQGPDGAVIIRGKLALGINNGDMCRDAAIAGLGIALLPAFIAGPAVNSGLLVEIDVGSRPEAEFIFMAHPEGRNPSAKLRAIADHLKKTFGDPPYWDPAG